MYFIPEKDQKKNCGRALERAVKSSRFDDEGDEFEFKAGFSQGFEAGVEFANLYITLHGK